MSILFSVLLIYWMMALAIVGPSGAHTTTESRHLPSNSPHSTRPPKAGGTLYARGVLPWYFELGVLINWRLYPPNFLLLNEHISTKGHSF